MARYRDKRNRGLEDFIITDRKANGVLYYQYKLPSGSKKSLPRPKGANDSAYKTHANKMARILNDKFNRGSAQSDANAILNDFVLANDNLDRTQTLIPALIQRYRDEYLPTRRLGKNTLVSKHQLCNAISKIWATTSIYDLDLTLLSKHLDTLTPNPYNVHRTFLISLFAFAKSKGLKIENVASNTLKKLPPRKKRQRLSIEGFNAIYEAAAPWLQRAMKLGIMTLQRRSDLVGLTQDDIYEPNLYPDYAIRFSNTSEGAEIINFDLTGLFWIHPVTGLKTLVAKTSFRKAREAAIELNTKHNLSGPRHLIVIQCKTAKHGAKGCLDIALTDELETVIHETLTSGLISPYLINCKPKKMDARALKNKLHWSAVTRAYLTNSFSRIRDTLPLFENMDMSTRPSWHELRALGGDMYLKQGEDKTFVNMLMGHTKDAMTQKYLDGHRVEFTSAAAGLNLHL